MGFLTLVFISLCLAVNIWAQKPYPCTSPPLLVGSMTVSSFMGEFFASASYSYDARGKRVRFREFGYQNNQSFHMDKLMLFRQGISYDISYHNHTCRKTALKAHFHPMEVPQDAELLGQVILGSSSAPGQGLLVNTWGGEVPEAKGKYFATFTEFGCLPVNSYYYSDRTGWIMTSFFNNMVGIKNPQDFIPPTFCETAELEAGEGAETDFYSALL